mgnify:CR=1 FL=1
MVVLIFMCFALKRITDEITLYITAALFVGIVVFAFTVA